MPVNDVIERSTADTAVVDTRYWSSAASLAVGRLSAEILRSMQQRLNGCTTAILADFLIIGPK
jgi:hypothetical protein